MNLPHPKPLVLAPVVGGPPFQDLVREELATAARRHEDVTEELAASHTRWQQHFAEVTKLIQAHDNLRGELSKAHARIETLESRWHERLVRWIRRQA